MRFLERGRELIAAQVVGVVVIKNGTYMSVDTSYCFRHIYLRFSRTSIAQGDVRRRLQFITEYLVKARL